MDLESCLESQSDSYPRNSNKIVSACMSDAFKSVHLRNVSNISARMRKLTSELTPIVRPPDPQEYVAFQAVSR